MNEVIIDNILTKFEGGPGSGFFKHLGRIGKRGGSLPREAGKVSAKFDFLWKFDFGPIKKPPIPYFKIVGGKMHGGTVAADELKRMGIKVPKVPRRAKKEIRKWKP